MLCASAGTAEQRRLGEITEEQFNATFGLNARGTLFTVQKALPLFNDGGSIFMTGSIASVRGYPSWSVYLASKAVLHACARVSLSELKDRRIRVQRADPGSGRRARTGADVRRRDEGRDSGVNQSREQHYVPSAIADSPTMLNDLSAEEAKR